MAAYPEHTWHPWKFTTVPIGFWRSLANQKQFLTWLESEWNFKSRDDWYGVTKSAVIQKGGSAMISHIYNGSIQAALKAVFPEYPWRPWKFENVRRNYWGDLENQREFMKFVAEQLKIRNMSDWYKVTAHDVSQLGGTIPPFFFFEHHFEAYSYHSFQ
jgi:hypothetical protein